MTHFMTAGLLAALFMNFACSCRPPRLFMNEKIKRDYLRAKLCLVGAVYFIFRS